MLAFKAELEAFLVRSSEHPKINESLIDPFFALCQLFSISGVFLAPLIVFVFRVARLLRLRGLSDEHLAHFVYEEGLLAREES